MTETETIPEGGEASQLASEIQARIAALESLFDEPLKEEMNELKRVLLSNPSAASLLKDEDVGLLVKALRRTVSVAIAEASAAKEKKPASRKTKPLTKDQLKQALLEGFPE